MKQFPLWLVATSLAVVSFESGGVAQEAPAPARAVQETKPVALEKVAEELSRLDDEFQTAIASVKEVVEKEAGEGRLPQATAQSLRWTLRSTASFTSMDFRPLLATAKVPVDNEAVSSAFQKLEGQWTTIQGKRVDLQKATIPEAIRRAGEIVENARKASEVEAVAETIEAARDALARRASVIASGGGSDASNTYATITSQLRNFQRFLEAIESRESSRIASAATLLQQQTSSFNRSATLDEKIRNRIEKDLKPLTEALDKAQEALDAGIEAGKPATELQVLLARYEDVSEKTPLIGSRQNSQATNAYRNIVSTLSQSDEGGDFRQVLRNAVEQVNSLNSKRASALRTALMNRQKSIEERLEKTYQEQIKQWRERLGTVKNASELNQLATDIQTSTTATSRRDRSGDEGAATFARALNSLATGWATANPQFLAQNNLEGGYGRMLYAAEVGILRQRIERDVLARSLEAPELNQPPLAAMETTAALEAFEGDLFKRQEWRRLLQLVETRQMLQGGRGYANPEGDLSSSIRAFITGTNLETAELWADAAAAYRSVMTSADNHAPVQASADRLKDLKAKHPEAFTAPAAEMPRLDPRRRGF